MTRLDSWIKEDSLAYAPPMKKDIGKQVFFIQTHSCQDGVCEHDPKIIPATIVTIPPYKKHEFRGSVLVLMEGQKQLVSSKDLYWSPI